MLLLAVLTVTTWAQTTYITEVMLVGKNNKTEAEALRDQYVAQGWTAIDQDLNAGCGSKSDYIYLLYKQSTTASPNHTFITNFLISDDSGTAPDTRDYDGCHYRLVPYDGDDHFKEKKGDLNSNAGGKDIHLYYTTEKLKDLKAVSQITFNTTKSFTVGTFDHISEGYDLNKGAGGDDIYMHCERNNAPVWVITKSSDGGRCIVNGFSNTTGAEDSKILAFPAIIDGAVVEGIGSANTIQFWRFSNLETIYFSQGYDASTIPSAYYSDGKKEYTCGKLKHIHVVDNSGAVVKADELPSSVTSITANGFRETAIETLKMPNVTSIGDGAFEDCIALASVTMPSVTSIGEKAFYGSYMLPNVTFPSGLVSIGNSAFAECSSLSSVSLPGSVTSIGDKAFNSYAITKVTIYGNPTIGENAFPDETSLTLRPRTKQGDGASWTTFYNEYANFQAQGAGKVYKATVSDGKVVLTEVADRKVPAGTAVVLKTGEGNSSVHMHRITSETSDTQSNYLYGVNTRTLIADMLDGGFTGYTFYLLDIKENGVGFYRCTDYWMPQNTAFLALLSADREFYPLSEDGATGIINVNDNETLRYENDSWWYSLDGRRLSEKPTAKGVYIHNGIKVVIK